MAIERVAAERRQLDEGERNARERERMLATALATMHELVHRIGRSRRALQGLSAEGNASH